MTWYNLIICWWSNSFSTWTSRYTFSKLTLSNLLLSMILIATCKYRKKIHWSSLVISYRHMYFVQLIRLTLVYYNTYLYRLCIITQICLTVFESIILYSTKMCLKRLLSPFNTLKGQNVSTKMYMYSDVFCLYCLPLFL